MAEARRGNGTRDPRVESWLQNEAVDFEFIPAVPIEKFDTKASIGNQARLTKPLNQDTVIEYALAMLDDAKFPGVICYRNEVGMYVLISGNHRIHAAGPGKDAANLETFGAYVVKTQDKFILERLIRSANNLEGMRPSREESIAQAVYLVQNRGMTAVSAAAQFHVPPEAVGRALRENKTKQRLATLGEDPGQFGAATLTSLHAIASDKVLKPVAELVREATLYGPVLDAFLKEVRGSKDEATQLSVVSQWRARPDMKDRVSKHKGGKIGRPTSGGDKGAIVMATMSRLRTLMSGAKTLDDLQITSPKEQERIKEMWLELKDSCQAVFRGR
jgi:hypothetical protein